jgi:hypothetical protein
MGHPGFDLSTTRPTNGALVLDPEGNNIEAVSATSRIVGDIGDDLYAPVGEQHRGEALTEHGVVVREQHPDRPIGVSVLCQYPSVPFRWCVQKGSLPRTHFGPRICASSHLRCRGVCPTAPSTSSGAIQ